MSYQLVKSQRFNQGYRGSAEEAVYTMTVPLPDQTGASQVLQNITDAHVQALAEQGSQLLELDVWQDSSPTWETLFRVRVVATTQEAPVNAIAVAPLVWVVVISTAVIIIGLLVDWALESVKTISQYAPVAAGIGATAMLVLAGAIAVVGVTYVLRR